MYADVSLCIITMQRKSYEILMGRLNWVHTLPLARDFLNHGLLKNCNSLLNQHSKVEKMKVPLNILESTRTIVSGMTMKNRFSTFHWFSQHAAGSLSFQLC